ncbi:MAG: hexameric tyrosine-coordinated heme protein [Pseudomonadota bacterium]
MLSPPGRTASESSSQKTPWLESLITPDPQSGYDLAIKLSRMAVKITQPSAEIRARLRPLYDSDADALVRIAGVVARNFHTVAAANRYWAPAEHKKGDHE